MDRTNENTLAWFAICLAGVFLSASSAWAETVKRIAIVWRHGPTEGTIEVGRGKLVNLTSVARPATVRGNTFRHEGREEYRLHLEIEDSGAPFGHAATLVTVSAARNPFSFFLRDVHSRFPIFLPAYGVVVTEAEDLRSYGAIAEDLRSRGLLTGLQEIENEPEESFESAASKTRSLKVPTWLGMSRDIRIFAVSERLDWIQPRFHGYEVTLPETGDRPVRYQFLMGRGWGPRERITRRLEDGVLPILRGRLDDGRITYEFTAFVGLEGKPPTALRGTHFLVADGYGRGHVFTAEQRKRFEELRDTELNQPEETILYLAAVAVNRSRAPAYAFFKSVWPQGVAADQWSFDPGYGFSMYRSGRVFAVSKLNGKPLAHDEVAILLQPGESATLEVYLPHRPIAKERALRLARQSFAERHAEIRQFWQQKLARAAQIHVPERRIAEMIRAGLLHLDLVAYGLEPGGTLTPTIGVYTAIGSESSPIIQFVDSMGWHDVARRALTYFLEKQHESGFMQNFDAYMLETGAALWSLGEHFRYTRDVEWVRQIAPKLIRACEYQAKWRQRNMREDLRGKGYGMLDGKTADPEDPYRSFMLNGYAYLGFRRVAEMLESVAPQESRRWRQEAEALKKDIRTALQEVLGRSPVVPLGDGTWCPTVPPWAEYRGPLLLMADGGRWFTHGAMTSRDSLLGPIYLIFQEVVDPKEDIADFLLNFHHELMTDLNVAFSQPYYSRHPMAHLRRGEVKPFLKAYYNTVASLADRETYTFYEHYFGASPHKTHEEAWFLMDTRWMLYMERGDTLELLAGIPRVWLEGDQRIRLDRAASYFGPLSLEVISQLETQNEIRATVTCTSDRKPRRVVLRLPHPKGLRAVWVDGGRYDARQERVVIENFTGKAHVAVGFQPRDRSRRQQQTGTSARDAAFAARLLRRLLHAPRTEAAGAHAQAPHASVDDRAHPLQVHAPLTAGDIVRVADPVPETGPAPTNFAYPSHERWKPPKANLYFSMSLGAPVA